MLCRCTVPMILSLWTSLAWAAPKGPCHGIKLEQHSTTLVWESRFTGSGPILLALHDGPKMSVLSVPVSSPDLSALKIGPGGVGTVKLADGTVITGEVPTTTSGEILLPSLGTIWRFDILISDADLQALAKHEIIGASLKAGPLVFDDRFLAQRQAPKLQRAAACLLSHMQREGRLPHAVAHPEPVSAPPAPSVSPDAVDQALPESAAPITDQALPESAAPITDQAQPMPEADHSAPDTPPEDTGATSL